MKKTLEESYHEKLGQMIKKVKKETKWRDIFKVVKEAQRRIDRGQGGDPDNHDYE